MKNLLNVLKVDFVETNQIGKNLRSFFCLLSCLILVFGSSFQSLAAISSSSNAFAVNPDYLIGSASNADPYGIATMDLTDEDYYIQPFSSVGSVTNTVDWSYGKLHVGIYDTKLNLLNTAYLNFNDFSSNGFDASYSLDGTVWDDSKYVITRVGFQLTNKGLPNPGSYLFSADFTSDFSYDISACSLWTQKNYSNAQAVDKTISISNYQEMSGDFYLPPYGIDLTNVNRFVFWHNIPSQSKVRNVSIFGRCNFTPSSGNYESTAGTNTSTQDYQSDVSGSLSDISSSIGDMSESLDSAAENLEYISTSQNLIIQGIDNVIMHISDQLYAFWDQLYNLIHEPTYARLGDILDAIRNLDLEITVEMKEVTDAVNKMNQDMQNKLQNVQQILIGGYDNSGINQDQEALDSSLQEYEQAEQNVLDNVNDSLNSFEFDSGMDEYKTSIQVFSDFLQALYESAGAFKIVINLSLMLSVAGIVIGLYRFKDGG